jgi:hypothetical protein
LHKLIIFIKNNPVCLSVLTLLKILNYFKFVIIVFGTVRRKYLNKQKYVNFFGLSNTSVNIRLFKNNKSWYICVISNYSFAIMFILFFSNYKYQKN